MQKVGTIEWACFEGGEPFLYHPLLVESVKLATEKGYKTAIETNTYWATTAKDAELWLRPLRNWLTTFPHFVPALYRMPVRLAAEHNLAHEDEYVDACHMCSKISLELVDRFPQHLAPRQVHGLK